ERPNERRVRCFRADGTVLSARQGPVEPEERKGGNGGHGEDIQRERLKYLTVGEGVDGPQRAAARALQPGQCEERAGRIVTFLIRVDRGDIGVGRDGEKQHSARAEEPARHRGRGTVPGSVPPPGGGPARLRQGGPALDDPRSD